MKITILCGIPGSGKSTYARWMQMQKPVKVVSADFFFYDKNGNYNFNPKKLGEAHGICQSQYLAHLMERVSPIQLHGEIVDTDHIVVDNTNVRLEHLNWYLDYALDDALDSEAKIEIVFFSADAEKCFLRGKHGLRYDKLLDMQEQFVETLQSIMGHGINDTHIIGENEMLVRAWTTEIKGVQIDIKYILT